MIRIALTLFGIGLAWSLSDAAASSQVDPARTPVFTVLHHFTGQGSAGGRAPQAALIIDGKNNLYGTTVQGGTGAACGATRCGTVFMLAHPAANTTTWTYTVLHQFTDGSDGALPFGSLLMDKTGALYGTTNIGNGAGTVYKLAPIPKSTRWSFSVLHGFSGGLRDGEFPLGELIADKTGALYGTTSEGGAFNLGIVFKLTPPATSNAPWALTVLYSFRPSTGNSPSNGLVLDAKGKFYGAAQQGGSKQAGTIFTLTPPATSNGSWGYQEPHTFVGPYTDGEFPANSLLLRNGILYGTTVEGGTNNLGTIFSYRLPSVNQPVGQYKVLHSFTVAEGTQIYSNLIADSTGALYGVAESGGAHNAGTIFKFKPGSGNKAGTLTALHDFVRASDGEGPMGGLVAGPGGRFFGTTSAGGAHNAGTIFMIVP